MFVCDMESEAAFLGAQEAELAGHLDQRQPRCSSPDLGCQSRSSGYGDHHLGHVVASITIAEHREIDDILEQHLRISITRLVGADPQLDSWHPCTASELWFELLA